MEGAPPPPAGGMRRPARRSGSRRSLAADAAEAPGAADSAPSRWNASPLTGIPAMAQGVRAASPPPKAPRSPDEVPLGLPVRPQRARPSQAQASSRPAPLASAGGGAAVAPPGPPAPAGRGGGGGGGGGGGVIARALYDFAPTEAMRRDFDGAPVLALRAGQLVELQRSDEGEDWWHGNVQGSAAAGAFPSTFVERLLESPKQPARSGGLRAELAGLKLSVLKKRAAQAGVDPQALIDADDADDVRGEVVALLLEHEREGEQAAPPEGAAAEGPPEQPAADLLFTALDADGDGVITRQEMRQGLSTGGPASALPSRAAPPPAESPDDAASWPSDLEDSSPAPPVDGGAERQAEDGEDAADDDDDEPVTPRTETPSAAARPAVPSLASDEPDEPVEEEPFTPRSKVHAGSPMSALNAKLLELAARDPKLGELVTELPGLSAPLEAAKKKQAETKRSSSSSGEKSSPVSSPVSATSSPPVAQEVEKHRQAIQEEKEAALRRLQQAETALRSTIGSSPATGEGLAPTPADQPAAAPSPQPSTQLGGRRAIRSAAEAALSAVNAAAESVRKDAEAARLARAQLDEQQSTLEELQRQVTESAEKSKQSLSEAEAEALTGTIRQEYLAELQTSSSDVETRLLEHVSEVEAKRRADAAHFKAQNATLREQEAHLETELKSMIQQLGGFEATIAQVQTDTRTAVRQVAAAGANAASGDQLESLHGTVTSLRTQLAASQQTAARAEARQTFIAKCLGLALIALCAYVVLFSGAPAPPYTPAAPIVQQASQPLVGVQEAAPQPAAQKRTSEGEEGAPAPVIKHEKNGAEIRVYPDKADSGAGTQTAPAPAGEDAAASHIHDEQQELPLGEAQRLRLAEDAKWKQELMAKQHAKLALHNAMSSSHLRQQLQRRGLSTKGGRDALLERLRKTIVAEHDELIEERERARKDEERHFEIEAARLKAEQDLAKARAEVAAEDARAKDTGASAPADSPAATSEPDDGITEDMCAENPVPPAAVLQAEASLRQELQASTLRQLKARIKSIGVDAAKVDAIDDAVDPKAAAIELLLAMEPHTGNQGQQGKTEARPSQAENANAVEKEVDITEELEAAMELASSQPTQSNADNAVDASAAADAAPPESVQQQEAGGGAVTSSPDRAASDAPAPAGEDLEAAAVAEAIAAPRIGADGEDRSVPMPRAESGVGRRDDTNAPAEPAAKPASKLETEPREGQDREVEQETETGMETDTGAEAKAETEVEVEQNQEPEPEPEKTDDAVDDDEPDHVGAVDQARAKARAAQDERDRRNRAASFQLLVDFGTHNRLLRSHLPLGAKL